MDSFTHLLSHPNQQSLSNSSDHSREPPSSVDQPGSSSSSDTMFIEEVVILASSRPKKRAGRRVFKETRHPVFRGVRRRNNDKWVCELREPNKKTRIWLGTYPTADMAARAHDVAALALRGKQACLNYADSAWRLPIPASDDQLDIRRAAAEAAERFRPEEFGGGYSSSGDDGDKEEKTAEEVLVVVEIKAISSNMTEYMNMEDEDLFDMPMLLTNMAEGLLLSPPDYNMDAGRFNDDVECGNDFDLWS